MIPQDEELWADLARFVPDIRVGSFSGIDAYPDSEYECRWTFKDKELYRQERSLKWSRPELINHKEQQ